MINVPDSIYQGIENETVFSQNMAEMSLEAVRNGLNESFGTISTEPARSIKGNRLIEVGAASFERKCQKTKNGPPVFSERICKGNKLGEDTTNTTKQQDSCEYDIQEKLKSFSNNILYFWGLSSIGIEEFPKILKEVKAKKLNVDPSDGREFSGTILFKDRASTEKAFVLIPSYKLSKECGFLTVSPIKRQKLNSCMKDRLRICPLPEDVDYSTLYDFMRVSGPIYELKIARNLDGVCTGVGYVKYFTNESGDMAFQELNFGTYKDTLVSLKVVKDRQLSGVKNNKDIPTMINSNCITNAADHAKPGDAADSSVVVVPGKLYVTNLHPTVSHVELFRMFKTYGYVHSARVSIDQSTGKSNGYGIVQMGTPEHATNALQALSGVMLKGKQVAIHRYEHLSEKEQHEHIPQRDRVSTEFFACDSVDGTRSSEYDNLASKRAGIQQEISSFSLEPNPSCSFSENPSTPPGLDASIIGSLSVLARSELLTQKIISELNNNTQYITSDAPEIITTLISLPLDHVIAILDSNALFPHEWAKARDILGENQPEHTILQVVRDSCLRNLKPHAASEQLLNCSPTGNCSNNSPASTPGFYTSSDSHKPTKKDSAASVFEHKRKHEHDSSLGSYNIDAEKYIDTLSSLSPSDKKQKLGAKLFPLVKGLGFSSPTRLTVYILDLYLGDAFAASNPSGLKRLVYSIYNSNSLREIATDVQRRSEADSFFHS